MHKIDSIIEKLSSFKTISKSQAQKLFLEIVMNDKSLDQLKSLIFEFDKISFCNICNNIIEKNEECQNCIKNAKKIIITETIEDNFRLLDEIFEDEKLFSLNFKNKSDFLNIDKINVFLKNIIKNINENTKEILVTIPFSVETGIIVETLKKNIPSDILVKTLPIGVSYNSSLKTIDNKTLRKAFDNGEKI